MKVTLINSYDPFFFIHRIKPFLYSSISKKMFLA